jgi:hypothetical protein
MLTLAVAAGAIGGGATLYGLAVNYGLL